MIEASFLNKYVSRNTVAASSIYAGYAFFQEVNASAGIIIGIFEYYLKRDSAVKTEADARSAIEADIHRAIVF